MTKAQSNGSIGERAGRSKQEVLLAVLLDEAEDAFRGRAITQKLTFLVQQKADAEGFRFEAGDYGPSSTDFYHVLDYLVDWDYAVEREEEQEDGTVVYWYEAGSNLNDVFGYGGHEDLREAAQTVLDEYPTDDLHALLEDVYTEYPGMARNSVI